MQPNSKYLLVYSILIILLFWIGKPQDYLWDDELLIKLNPWKEDPTALLQLWRWDLWHEIPGEHFHSWYRPIMALHIWIDQWLFGDALLPKQGISLLWYLGLLITLPKYLTHLKISAQQQFLAIPMIVLHPFQMELLYFIAARNDTMVLCFSLWAILSRQILVKAILILLALLTKESALVLFPLLLLLNWSQNLEYKQSTALFCGLALCYLGWTQYLDLETFTPNFKGILPIITQYYSGLLWSFQYTTANYPTDFSFVGFFIAMSLSFIPLLSPQSKSKWLLWIGGCIFLVIGALAANASLSLSYRYANISIFFFSILLSGHLLHRFNPTALLTIIVGLYSIGIFANRKQWQHSTQLWQESHLRLPSSHTACGWFMQSQNEPEFALELLQQAITAPPSQHCCFQASRFTLKHFGPQSALDFGSTALNNGCLASPEVLAPMALSHTLIGNWEQGFALANQLQRDPFGYSPVIIVAFELRNGQTEALKHWSKTPEEYDMLYQKATQLIQQSQQSTP